MVPFRVSDVFARSNLNRGSDLPASIRYSDMQTGDQFIADLVPLAIGGRKVIELLGCEFLSHDATIRLQRSCVRVRFGVVLRNGFGIAK